MAMSNGNHLTIAEYFVRRFKIGDEDVAAAYDPRQLTMTRKPLLRKRLLAASSRVASGCG